MAEYNGHVCAGKKGAEAAPQKKERKGDRLVKTRKRQEMD